MLSRAIIVLNDFTKNGFDILDCCSCSNSCRTDLHFLTLIQVSRLLQFKSDTNELSSFLSLNFHMHHLNLFQGPRNILFSLAKISFFDVFFQVKCFFNLGSTLKCLKSQLNLVKVCASGMCS